MALLRRRYLAVVWATFFPMLIVCQLPWFLIVRAHGWPEVKVHEMEPEWIPFAAYATTVLLSNLPDVVSTGIYAVMLAHFGKANNAVHPAAEGVENGQQQQDDDDELPAGGIWMGEDEHQDVAGGIWVGGNGDYPVGGDHESSRSTESSSSISDGDSSSHNVQASMRALGRHVALALMDLVMIAFGYFHCSAVGKASAYVYDVVFCFAVPFLLIGASCPQLGLCQGHHCSGDQ